MQRLVAIAALGVLALSACASSTSGSVYERRQARTVQTVELGVVERVRPVLIEGTKSGIGAAAGATAGSVIGSGGGGHYDVGHAVGGIAGAVVGGIAGAAAEEGATRHQGLEITVRLESGHLIAVTQAADEAFNVGDSVRILSGQGVTRVTH